MGLYDRDYGRDEPQQGINIGSWSMVTTLIVINVAIFLVDMLFFERAAGPGDGIHGEIAATLSLHRGMFTEHWRLWELLTYGFMHATISHVGWNMFGLWLWGRDVESIYGRRMMLWTYLTLVIGAGLITAVFDRVPNLGGATVLGASGAVFGITIISVCFDPMKRIFIWGVFPVPAWSLATFYLLTNAMMLRQEMSGQSTGIAVVTHLAGAALGYLVYRTRWTLDMVMPSNLSFKKLRRGPKLRIHQPEQTEKLSERVDAILEKISREGEGSLTKDERKILVDASRRYQRRKSGNT